VGATSCRDCRDIFVEGSEIDVDPAIPLNGLIFFYRSASSARRSTFLASAYPIDPNLHDKI